MIHYKILVLKLNLFIIKRWTFWVVYLEHKLNLQNLVLKIINVNAVSIYKLLKRNLPVKSLDIVSINNPNQSFLRVQDQLQKHYPQLAIKIPPFLIKSKGANLPRNFKSKTNFRINLNIKMYIHVCMNQN